MRASPVRAVLAADDPGWLALVREHPEATIFHQPAWLGLIAETYHYRPFVVAVQDPTGAVLAGVPICAIASALTGRRWVSLPFTDRCMPLARNPAALAGLLTELRATVAAGRVPRIELRANVGPVVGDGSEAEPRAVWHELTLAETAAATRARFHPMHARNLRRAQQAGLRVERSTAIDAVREFYRLHLLTRRRQGVPVQPWRFFAGLQARLLAPGHGFVALVRDGRDAVAGAVFLDHGDTVVYKYGASDPARLAARPNHLVFWSAIEWAVAAGRCRLDFGRTDAGHPGLRAFKRGWGAAERPLRYTTFGRAARLPSQSGGGVLAHVIRRSPATVCRVLGELLYGHVG